MNLIIFALIFVHRALKKPPFFSPALLSTGSQGASRKNNYIVKKYSHNLNLNGRGGGVTIFRDASEGWLESF